MTATGDEPGHLTPPDTWLRLQTLLLSTEDLNAFLIELAGLGAAVMDPVAACGITTRYGSQPITVASSDERAARLDESQYTSGDGPCLHALRSGQTVSVPDTGNDDRWPEFMAYARAQGLRCSLSFPLLVRESTVGAMNFYVFHSAMAFDFARHSAGAIFAAQASGALELIMRSTRNRQQLEQLEQALGSRSTIDQAMGILMATQGCTAEQAFDTLRTRSQNSQRKLRLVAGDLIEQVSRAAGGTSSAARGSAGLGPAQ